MVLGVAFCVAAAHVFNPDEDDFRKYDPYDEL